jgi:hypothetical protein
MPDTARLIPRSANPGDHGPLDGWSCVEREIESPSCLGRSFLGATGVYRVVPTGVAVDPDHLGPRMKVALATEASRPPAITYGSPCRQGAQPSPHSTCSLVFWRFTVERGA